MKGSKPLVSVVIPAYNEATYIDRLLDALVKQEFGNFEVIVSDADSRDGTERVVDSFKDKLDIKMVTSPPKGPGAGRNEGAKVARGEWLLFLDADNDIDDDDFIKRMVNEATERRFETVSAKVKVKNASLIERFGTWFNYRYTRLLAHTKHPVAPGWCILTKSAIFEKNHGFNEKIQFGEDYDYVTRAASGGFGFVDETYYYMDLRRYRQFGFRFVLKGILNEIYRHTHGYRLETNPYNYEFGKHKKREK